MMSRLKRGKWSPCEPPVTHPDVRLPNSAACSAIPQLVSAIYVAGIETVTKAHQFLEAMDVDEGHG